MPYKNLVAQGIASRAEAFKRFRDWMCKRNGSYDYSVTGLGWTLHDAVYATDEHTIAAGDYFVIYSPGESGKEDLYVRVVYSGTANINQITIHQYWNSTTHTGVNSMTNVSNWQVADVTSGALYIYADLDSCIVGTYIGTSKFACAFGLTEALYDRTIATSTNAVTAGSNRVVTLDVVPASWVVGGKVIVRDDANIELVTISNISELDVTFTTFVASYTAGCKFAKDYPVMCANTTSMVGIYRVLFGHDGTKMDTFAANALAGSPGTSGDPEPLDGEFLATPYHMQDTSGGYLGTIRNALTGSAVGYTDLGVYTTPDSVNYRAFISFNAAVPLLAKEV